MEAAATSSLGREIVRLVQGRQPNQSLEFIGQGFSDALLLRVFTAPVYHAMSQRGESTIPKLAFSPWNQRRQHLTGTDGRPRSRLQGLQLFPVGIESLCCRTHADFVDLPGQHPMAIFIERELEARESRVNNACERPRWLCRRFNDLATTARLLARGLFRGTRFQVDACAGNRDSEA